jgi:hypothetical protein
MIVFKLIFAGLTAYGIWIGLYGAALLSLLMLGFVYYSEAMMHRQENNYRRSPRSAVTVPDTLDLLDHKACACSESSFPSQISKPDSES